MAEGKEERVYPKGYKTPSQSEETRSKSVMPGDINGDGRLYGGRLMEWIDEVSALAAIRHCCHNVTTAAVDNLQFKASVKLGEIVVIISRVTYVGRTSIEVRTDTYSEDIETGMRKPINRAYFTEVCIDKEGRPVPIEYGLKIETESEQAEYEGALKRIEMRKKRREEGF